MRTFLRILLAMCLVAVPVGRSVAQSPSSGTVWVAVRVADKGPGQPGAEYCGTVDWKSVGALLAMPNPSGFLELNHAFWLINGKIIPLSDAGVSGINYGYENTVYLRIDTVYRIIRLRDSFVKEHALVAK